MASTREYMISGERILLHQEIEWKPAIFSQLTRYPCGTLCKDRKGNVFLIGDAIEGEYLGVGCGCCSSIITDEEIIETAVIFERTPHYASGAIAS